VIVIQRSGTNRFMQNVGNGGKQDGGAGEQ
jgi:hypothetical protein